MLATRPKVLVADDQEDVRVALGLLLKGEGFEVTTVDSPAAALTALGQRRYDAALVDLNYTRDTTSGAEGLDLLHHVRASHPGVPLLVMTAWGTLELAVTAMKRGARDFVLKPWDNAALVRALRTQIGSLPRAAQDLELARRVQAELLPRREPLLRTLQLSARCVQAGAVGGDAYDFVEVGPGSTGIALADASGKGVSAALLMANLIGCLRAGAARAGANLVGMLNAVHRQFLASTAPEHYATPSSACTTTRPDCSDTRTAATTRRSSAAPAGPSSGCRRPRRSWGCCPTGVAKSRSCGSTKATRCSSTRTGSATRRLPTTRRSARRGSPPRSMPAPRSRPARCGTRCSKKSGASPPAKTTTTAR